jgi:hypothetical protein
MGSDAAVNLEVTVPSIVLSTKRKRPEQREASLPARQQSANSEDEAREQVRLLPVDFQQDTSSRQWREQHSNTAEVSTRMTHALRFRLFRITIPAPAQGRSFLLQVLRRYKKHIGKKLGKSNKVNEDSGFPEQFSVTDSLSFSIAFRHLNGTTETTPTPTLTPGLHQVVIYLDNEGTPVSYSIDGAES